MQNDQQLSCLSLESEVAQASECLSTEIDGQIVLMSVSSGVYGGLDKIGSQIWQKLQTPVMIRALVQDLAQAYGADVQQVETDVLRFLSELHAKNMLKVRAAGE